MQTTLPLSEAVTRSTAVGETSRMLTSPTDAVESAFQMSLGSRSAATIGLNPSWVAFLYAV
jgi:hypothetical protein